jgi:phenylacetate-coenzyme A ligase PaaK-like adenylate-forming protein
VNPLLDAARLFRLRETWEYARRHSAFYAERLPPLPVEKIDFATLRLVPILTRADLQQHHEALRCSRELPAYIMFSGGTTGTPLMVYGSEWDLEQTYATYAERWSQAEGPRPLMLSTGAGAQGGPPHVPGRCGMISVPLRSRQGYEWAWRMLTAEHRFDGYATRVTRLVLPLPAVKKLVHFMLERGHTRDELALDSVCSFSAHVSTPWRRLIEETLGAPLTDAFGFTEVPKVRAFRVPDSEFFAFHDDHTIWDVADPWDKTPLDAGIGRLLVTSLVPFSRERVLFRYASGDLVEIGPDPPGEERGFRFKGRLGHSAAVEHGGRRHLAVFPTDVQELVDLDPWVARFSNRRHAGVTASEDDSFPKWRFVQAGEGGTRLTLEVELTSSPSLHFRPGRDFEERVRAGLLALNPALRELVARGAVEWRVRAVPPGTIDDDEVRRC